MQVSTHTGTLDVFRLIIGLLLRFLSCSCSHEVQALLVDHLNVVCCLKHDIYFPFEAILH